MAVRHSLNRYAPSFAVLPCLGIRCPTTCWPRVVQCLLCGSPRMDIYSDFDHDGEWHLCRDCGSSGDLIQLAARTWNTDEYGAVQRLAELGVPFPPEEIEWPGIQKYVTNHVDRRRRITEFVNNRSRDFLSTSAETTRLAKELGLRWSSGGCVRRMGRFIFESNVVEMSQLLQPHVKDQTTATSGSGRVFRGRKWRNVLVIPFGDFPGRVTGFLMLGRDGGPEDIVFRSVYCDRCVTRDGRNHVPVEAGLAMSEVLHQPTYRRELFGYNFIVSVNPLAALAIQSRHLRDNELPLPLVGAYDGLLPPTRFGNCRPVCSQYVWWCQPRRSYIFWHPRLTPELFSLACRPAGKVSVVPPPDHRRRLLPHVWLQEVQRSARPWRDVLVETLEQLPRHELPGFIKALGSRFPLFEYVTGDYASAVQKILRNHTVLRTAG